MSKQGEQVRKWGVLSLAVFVVSLTVVICVQTCRRKTTPVVPTVTAVVAEPEATEFLVMTESATNDLAVEIKEEQTDVGTNKKGIIEFRDVHTKLKFE